MATSVPRAAHAAIRLRAAISQLTRALRTRGSPGVARLGVLGHLYRLGPCTPTRLARHERVRLQTLTRPIADLETAKLIRRRPHADDARQTLLSLTAAGIRVLQADVVQGEASLASAIETYLSARERTGTSRWPTRATPRPERRPPAARGCRRRSATTGSAWHRRHAVGVGSASRSRGRRSGGSASAGARARVVRDASACRDRADRDGRARRAGPRRGCPASAARG